MGKMKNGEMQLYVVKGNIQQCNIQANHMIFLVCSHSYIISFHIKMSKFCLFISRPMDQKMGFEENGKQININVKYHKV